MVILLTFSNYLKQKKTDVNLLYFFILKAAKAAKERAKAGNTHVSTRRL